MLGRLLGALASAWLVVTSGCAPRTGPLPEPAAEADAGGAPDGGATDGGVAARWDEGHALGRRYLLFVPAQAAQGPVPLVVMLHGCLQTPEDFARGTRMDEVASREGFALLFPEQPTSANASRCWGWSGSENQSRGQGEAALLAGLVDEAAQRVPVNRTRVYAAGLSAGAAMSVVLGATYPDVFAGIGVHSGLEYQAATTALGGTWAMAAGGPDPATCGRRAFAAMGGAARAVRVWVLHGGADSVVAPLNGAQVAAQWVTTDDLATDGVEDGNVSLGVAQADDADEGGRHLTRTRYADLQGRVWVEALRVDGLGHAWSGGSSDGSYADPLGPSASERLWAFFAGR